MHPPAIGLIKYAKLPASKPPSHRLGELKSWLQVEELKTNWRSMAISFIQTWEQSLMEDLTLPADYNSITMQNLER